MTKPTPEGIKIISRNRRAHERFTILESFEAGIALQGNEVKSLRQGTVSIEDGVVRVDKDEMFLMNVYIPPYIHISYGDYEPTRTRKLLMHRREIQKLAGQAQLKGLTLIPLELYFKKGLAKVSVGLARGKKMGDRREEIQKREVERKVLRKFS
ncbi:MAG: SsrA-binding protein SmpB [Elusimicrobia bacterium]|nr:SsrA-binding protein SmpB [Elusimicrobiota bacterium]